MFFIESGINLCMFTCIYVLLGYIYMPPSGARVTHAFSPSFLQGEVHPRILTCGAPERAELVAQFFDKEKPVTRIRSPRDMVTISGYFQGVPITICAIGMGTPMADFFLREASAVCATPIAVIRLGTCGLVDPTLKPGTVVIATKGSLYCYRNYCQWDGNAFDSGSKSLDNTTRSTVASPTELLHVAASQKNKKRRVSNSSTTTPGNATNRSHSPSSGRRSSSPSPSSSALSDNSSPREACPDSQNCERGLYCFTKPISADPELSSILMKHSKATYTGGSVVGGLNGCGESFYSTQGREDNHFNDMNSHVIDVFRKLDVTFLEMETYKVFHLAKWRKIPCHAAACAIGIVNRTATTDEAISVG
jgi:uridine phosphorylase